MTANITTLALRADGLRERRPEKLSLQEVNENNARDDDAEKFPNDRAR
jgi:hypothetical protein